MTTLTTGEAAAILWRNWRDRTRIDQLPGECRPETHADGYAVQAEVARLSGQSIAGWKIAATSAAGQRHIGVDGPFAGRLLSNRVIEAGALVPLDRNIMKVAEAEFAFRFGASLTPRHPPFDVDVVLDAVEALLPAIEVPDSRYTDFARVGAPQLIADTACACWVIFGDDAPPDWRDRDLAAHRVSASRNGAPAGQGIGANVLGDPRVALTWIANELATIGEGLRAGDIVITGTCVTPVSIAIGDRVRMDFGELGAIEASFAGV
jgi:2-keto-4-pentenoate hydratase